jgi:hypothetical protein
MHGTHQALDSLSDTERATLEGLLSRLFVAQDRP